MISLINFEICTDAEKNSATIGRMLIVCYLKINEILNVSASKNVIWIGQNTKVIGERLIFLSAALHYYKKTFMITPSFQKQTP